MDEIAPSRENELQEAGFRLKGECSKASVRTGTKHPWPEFKGIKNGFEKFRSHFF